MDVRARDLLRFVAVDDRVRIIVSSRTQSVQACKNIARSTECHRSAHAEKLGVGRYRIRLHTHFDRTLRYLANLHVPRSFLLWRRALFDAVDRLQDSAEFVSHAFVGDLLDQILRSSDDLNAISSELCSPHHLYTDSKEQRLSSEQTKRRQWLMDIGDDLPSMSCSSDEFGVDCERNW